MVCQQHNAPAAFFSEKEDRYVCFKCLVSTEKLLYIDKSYKQEMDDFERIKALTMEAVNSNANNTTIIRNWKMSIRECLMRIRTKYIDLIDKFIYQFGVSFKNVETSDEMMEFRGEDKKL